MRLFGFFESSHKLSISANTSDYNLYIAMGSPANPIKLDATIESGVVVSSTSGGTPAFSLGNFAVGSTIKLTNNGQIIGKGGAGSGGATAAYPSVGNASSGDFGGNALELGNTDVIFDNTNGDVFGGGGGGGGGGSASDFFSGTSRTRGGGGGGGGAGNSGGAGGIGGTATGGTASNIPGTAGSGGTTTGGAGGDGGGTPPTGDGGAGGGYGVAGTAGTANVLDGTGSLGTPGAGGAAGKAIELNGNSITWLGGNNPTQVKGAVS